MTNGECRLSKGELRNSFFRFWIADFGFEVFYLFYNKTGRRVGS
ncbi:hypothetical protein D1AOALGA4SA_13165 [Olavius algarvensis Delta 1 endosymbiont]|nr:hypothetical protein D1AOALGA4SA_13165 [Olavius algarvensis Delta 1 endosymbiont]